MILDDYITACIQLHIVLGEKSANNFYQKIRKTLYTLQFAVFFIHTYSQRKTCAALSSNPSPVIALHQLMQPEPRIVDKGTFRENNQGCILRPRRVYLKVWNKGLPMAIKATPRILDRGELLFDNEYLLKFESKKSSVRDLWQTDFYKKNRSPIP